MLEIQSHGGRYPENKLYKREHVTANIERIENQLRISIMDAANPERWEDFWVKIKELKEEIEDEGEDIPFPEFE